MKAEYLKYTNRVRFNWGFHDGASAAKNNREPMWEKGSHFDRAYEAGYWMGHKEFQEGKYNDDRLSDEAWEEYNK